MNIKYDWDWMREYYARSQQNSRTSLKDIASLYGVPYQSVRRKAAEENWVGMAAVFRERIQYFKDLETQSQYLYLAKQLARKDYRNVEAILALDPID